ncbi:hypothetical protein BKA80DRAFT_273259 [Phyllosticta citrichinensis]
MLPSSLSMTTITSITTLVSHESPSKVPPAAGPRVICRDKDQGLTSLRPCSRRSAQREKASWPTCRQPRQGRRQPDVTQVSPTCPALCPVLRAQIFHPRAQFFVPSSSSMVANVIGICRALFRPPAGTLEFLFSVTSVIPLHSSLLPFIQTILPPASAPHRALPPHTHVWICTSVPCWIRIRRHALACLLGLPPRRPPSACLPTDVSEDFLSPIFCCSRIISSLFPPPSPSRSNDCRIS